MDSWLLFWLSALTSAAENSVPAQPRLPYAVVDTGQIRCFNNTREIPYPKQGDAFFGQDAQYQGLAPAYKDNSDGTITDLSTGLMWAKDPGKKKTYFEAAAGAKTCRVGGYADWRLPTIKELYSLILFVIVQKSVGI